RGPHRESDSPGSRTEDAGDDGSVFLERLADVLNLFAVLGILGLEGIQRLAARLTKPGKWPLELVHGSAQLAALAGGRGQTRRDICTRLHGGRPKLLRGGCRSAKACRGGGSGQA